MIGYVTGGPYAGQWYWLAHQAVAVDYYQTSLPGWVTAVLVDKDGEQAVRDIPIKFLGE